MKYFIVADVHSFYDEMREALKEAGFDKKNPNHIFVSLGDLLDRGSQPLECLKFVCSLPKGRKILIRGNHEDLLEECLERGEFYRHDEHNGTMKTILDLAGRKVSDVYDYIYAKEYAERFPEFALTVPDYHEAFAITAENKLLKKYLKSVIDFAEIDNAIFVHGWIPARKSAPNKDWHLGDWKEARWFNGMEKWYQGARIPNKTIFCGHWHTSWGFSHLRKECSEFGNDAKFEPFVDDGIVALDACAAWSHKVNCYVLDITEKETENEK